MKTPSNVPEPKMRKTLNIRWEVEKGPGPSPWKSPEGLAASPGESELCNDGGSGSLRARLPDPRKESPRARAGWLEAGRRIQSGRERCGVLWVPEGCAEPAGVGEGGGVCADWEANGVQRTKPGRGAGDGHGSPASRLSRGPGTCRRLADGRRARKGASPAPASLTSNISPMRTQSTRQKPMSAWLWMTNSWLKSG